MYSNMVQDTERLARLIETDVGECYDGDVDARLEDLEEHASAATGTLESDVATLKALGNETRLAIARLLARADRELCVCEITPVIDVSDSAISHALSDLTDAGLVTRRREGTWRYYDTTDRAKALLAALDDTREGTR